MTKSISGATSSPTAPTLVHESDRPAGKAALENPQAAGFKPLGARKNGSWKIFAFHLGSLFSGGKLYQYGARWADQQLAGTQKLSAFQQDIAESYLNTTVGFSNQDLSRYGDDSVVDLRSGKERALHRLAAGYARDGHSRARYAQAATAAENPFKPSENLRETRQEKQRRVLREADAIRSGRPANQDDPRLTVAEVDGASRLLQATFAEVAAHSGHDEVLALRQSAQALAQSRPADAATVDRMNKSDLLEIYNAHFDMGAERRLDLGDDINKAWDDLFTQHLGLFEHDIRLLEQEKEMWTERLAKADRGSLDYDMARTSLMRLKIQLRENPRSDLLSPETSEQVRLLLKRTEEACRRQLEPVAARLGELLTAADDTADSNAPELAED